MAVANQYRQSEQPYYVIEKEEVLEHLESDEQGLSPEEASRRLDEHGQNVLDEGKKTGFFAKLWEQLKSVMILVLIAAAGLSIALGEYIDGGVILIVVGMIVVLGLVQESKAEAALEALQEMSSPHASVRRDGEIEEIESSELVPGDIVVLESGDVVPADLRLIKTNSLQIDESALTGESLPVDKQTDKLEDPDLVVGDRVNLGFMSSIVSGGRGEGVVIGTGMTTEVGSIAGHLNEDSREKTPLQKRLDHMGKILTVLAIGVAAALFGIGWLQGRDPFEMFMITISVAVSAIPEGLPAVVTIILAVGVKRMAGRKAIIRKLPAIETLGSTQVICSDKTGTLTQNRMTVQQYYVNGETADVSEETDERSRQADATKGEDATSIFIQVLSLCNDAKLDSSQEEGETSGESSEKRDIGDPTDIGLARFARDLGAPRSELEQQYPREGEIPFDSTRKLMTTAHAVGENGAYRLMVKGAPDVLLERCTQVHGDGVEELTDERREQIRQANQDMTDDALRVLAFAYRESDKLPDESDPETYESDLIFVGLAGMIDPPRENAIEAVRVCREAGIRPVMITGDHAGTAAAIARQLDILKEGDEVLTGAELDKLDDKEFEQNVDHYSVYARVSPEHKVRIVKAWKKKGKVVAMTGDGVNDAPALKASDIGVGMGISGTDAAKNASKMVLTDDNFGTIVVAVEEGRKVFSNIRKSIQFLLSANFSQVTTIFIATSVGWSILTPIQILWINLVDTLPGLALGMEKSEGDEMKKSPRKPDQGVFADGLGIRVLYQGALQAMLVLAVFIWGLNQYSSEEAVSMAFIALGAIQLTHAYNARSATGSVFKLGFFSNKYLNWAVLASGVLLLGISIPEFMHPFFGLVPLGLSQWAVALIAAIAIIPLVELVKFFIRASDKKAAGEGEQEDRQAA
ncbi:cation-translocating P-type ATPase [Saccharibacillus sacchari]|uniref:cation-translocating P-type ATPase n=1 Tax=Saccharibacillus sacchari TaxID=456493 RepID=UPI0004B3216E|nr:cation-translocating P-type ATPase [Saccharibacillus sacchari]